eukprot:scaffold245771_cov71-Attheya_sp.AAC.1
MAWVGEKKGKDGRGCCAWQQHHCGQKCGLIGCHETVIAACYSIPLACCIAWHTCTPHAYAPHMTGDLQTCHYDAA